MNETTTASAATTVMPVGDDSNLPHIIIVGGGAGGLELATRLGDKLGLRDRAALTRYAVQMGLLSPEKLVPEKKEVR